ncbi:MAG: heat-inducible transcriptional repressor HrcA [Acidimicrobiales bacterium]
MNCPNEPGRGLLTSNMVEGDPLDERKSAILNAVVTEYIDTAQPVGSAHVVRAPGVQVSSATVRNEMAALEREGYLTQPHTSAGRIPTDKGYRFFVDHLGAPGRLDSLHRQQVRRFFAHVHGEVEELLDRSSQLLANLTDCAALVVGPTHEMAPIRSVQLVGLNHSLALLVVVLADGAVEKRTINLPDGVDDEMLTRATSYLSRHLRGSTLTNLRSFGAGGDPSLESLLMLGIEALRDLAGTKEPEHVFVGGSSRMAAAFDAADTVRSVLSILEQQLVVVELVEEILDRGLSVAIGTEHGFEPLAGCALVVAPVSVDGETAGTIGVLGPTRMRYALALAAVREVGAQLGGRLGRGRSASSAKRDGSSAHATGRIVPDAADAPVTADAAVDGQCPVVDSVPGDGGDIGEC